MVVMTDEGVAICLYYCDGHWLQLHRDLRQARSLDLVLKVVAV
jgi:hypothetical protein